MRTAVPAPVETGACPTRAPVTGRRPHTRRLPRTDGASYAAGAATSPVPGAVTGRGDARAYDHLEPVLQRHAASSPGEPGHHARRERLIREFLPLVHNIARRYAGARPGDDIEQAGVLGLIKAIDRYDPAASTHGPLTYLVPSVRGEMLRHLRDHTWAMRVPRDLKDAAVHMNRATDALTHRLGRSPRPSELAEELDLPVSTVVETLAMLESCRTVSLDVPHPVTGWTLAEQTGDEDPSLDLIDHRDDLRRVIAELPERERTILLLRFYGEQTQLQIADRMGLSQMHVSRLLARTLERLRSRLCVDDRTDVVRRPAGASR